MIYDALVEGAHVLFGAAVRALVLYAILFGLQWVADWGLTFGDLFILCLIAPLITAPMPRPLEIRWG